MKRFLALAALYVFVCGTTAQADIVPFNPQDPRFKKRPQPSPAPQPKEKDKNSKNKSGEKSKDDKDKNKDK